MKTWFARRDGESADAWGDRVNREVAQAKATDWEPLEVRDARRRIIQWEAERVLRSYLDARRQHGDKWFVNEVDNPFWDALERFLDG